MCGRISYFSLIQPIFTRKVKYFFFVLSQMNKMNKFCVENVWYFCRQEVKTFIKILKLKIMAKKREILKFKDWLDENPTLTDKTVRDYISYVRNIPLGKISNALSRDAVEDKDKEQVNYANKILNNLKSKDSDDSEKFVDSVVTLVEEGYLIYARTIVDVVCDAVAKVKAKEEFKNTNLVKNIQL